MIVGNDVDVGIGNVAVVEFVEVADVVLLAGLCLHS